MLIFECTFSLANVVHLVRLEYLKLAFDVCEALRTCSFARSTMAGEKTSTLASTISWHRSIPTDFFLFAPELSMKLLAVLVRAVTLTLADPSAEAWEAEQNHTEATSTSEPTVENSSAEKSPLLADVASKNSSGMMAESSFVTWGHRQPGHHHRGHEHAECRSNDECSHHGPCSQCRRGWCSRCEDHTRFEGQCRILDRYSCNWHRLLRKHTCDHDGIFYGEGCSHGPDAHSAPWPARGGHQSHPDAPHSHAHAADRPHPTHLPRTTHPAHSTHAPRTTPLPFVICPGGAWVWCPSRSKSSCCPKPTTPAPTTPAPSPIGGMTTISCCNGHTAQCHGGTMGCFDNSPTLCAQFSCR